jgi:adenylate cyclase
LFALGRYDEVIRVLGRMRDRTQGTRLLAACQALAGHLEQARAYGREVLAAQPAFSIEEWTRRLPRDPDPEIGIRYAQGLRLAGLPE